MKIAYDIPVSEVMSFPVITATKDMTIYDIANIMTENNIGAVVIVENNKPVGILTERDIVKRVVSKNLKPKDVLAEEVMSKKIVTIPQNASLTEAAKIMATHGIKRLPVVKDGELVGIITQSDIVKVSPELLEIVAEYASIKPEEEKPIPLGTDEFTEEYIDGICESCGYQGKVRLYQGRYLCDECIEEFEEKEE
ncbi:CBS domain-containing protein [Methanocaldococcus fervens]|uniref:Signal transduction protein with CBS domains n=1 Tax=Methanocaldococcus fervens (strain DSM 4213 / JCM 15782 / AG86) TaxID=573064 RepID=C7P7F3_METFA|nr:CBS domain-containing protein [Methanocaldococcus fervens]ACV24485.1 putative signal transduction protein with CBS domains [Methanocaldococcus fervens AG86]